MWLFMIFEWLDEENIQISNAILTNNQDALFLRQSVHRTDPVNQFLILKSYCLLNRKSDHEAAYLHPNVFLLHVHSYIICLLYCL